MESFASILDTSYSGVDLYSSYPASDDDDSVISVVVVTVPLPNLVRIAKR